MEKMRKILAVKAAMRQESGFDPSTEEIALRVGMPAEKVTSLLELLPEVCSLDAPAGEDDSGTLQLLLEDTLAPEPQQELVRRELKQVMDSLLDKLTDRQQQVLRLRFGMEDGTCYSLERIGSILGISKERARQLEKQGIEKLQKLGSDLGLEDFLE